jgi:hypothetical protein
MKIKAIKVQELNIPDYNAVAVMRIAEGWQPLGVPILSPRKADDTYLIATWVKYEEPDTFKVPT